MQITIEMIESKEFKIRPKGYDQQEVDEFLDAICDEMAAQQDQIQSLQQQLMSAQAKRPAPVAAPAAQPVVTADAANSLKEILEMAQKVKSETIAAAEKQAEEIRVKAQQEADEQLKGLQAERDSLTRQVSDLKAAAAAYRAQFEALLQSQQEAIEKAANLF